MVSPKRRDFIIFLPPPRIFFFAGVYIKKGCFSDMRDLTESLALSDGEGAVATVEDHIDGCFYVCTIFRFDNADDAELFATEAMDRIENSVVWMTEH